MKIKNTSFEQRGCNEGDDVEDVIKAFLDEYYPRFADYTGSEGSRDAVYEERLEIKRKLELFLKNEFPTIMARLGEDESQYQRVYEVFDLIAKASYQAGRQHYLSFFGAKRYYDYSGKKEQPSLEVLGKFQGAQVKENIAKLYNLLTSDRSQLPQHFDEILKIPFVGWNLATAFLMYLNPEEFLMVNEKTFHFLEKLGIKRPTTKSFEGYEKLRKFCLEIRNYSTRYADGGFRDFLDMDWFEHLFAIGELGAKPLFEGFLKEDFRHFTGKREDARYLQRRFKKLKEAIKPMLPSALVEKLWVPRIRARGQKEYRRSMWVGTSHPEYEDPRLGIQFQFYANKDNSFAGIWGEGPARQARNEAAERIRANSKYFIELVRKLPSDHTLYVFHEDFEKAYQPTEFDEKKLEEFVEHVPTSGMYFSIGPWLTPQQTIDKKEKILDFYAKTVDNLLPLYSVITGKVIQVVEAEEKKPEVLQRVEKAAFAHLLAGKNLVLYGPPGTGKTLLAKHIVRKFCKNNFLLRTANAEWTTYDVVGGVTFSGRKETAPDETPFLRLGFRKGFLTRAAEEVNKELPCWLIIDEINRANLDLSFGKAFTLLDIDHRTEPLVDKDEYPDVSSAIHLPRSFRIIATMNSYDRAILFSLGFAFRRRFAFLELPSPFKLSLIKYDLDKEIEQNWHSRVTSLVKDEVYKSVQGKIEEWINVFSDDERLLFSSFPNFERNLKEIFEKVKKGAMDPYNPQAVTYSMAKEITEKGLVEFGYAQIVDGLKFVLAYLALELTDHDDFAGLVVEVVDETFLAYFIPQFEYILPELRREKISAQRDRRIEDTIDEIIQILDELGLKQSISKMRTLKKEQTVF